MPKTVSLAVPFVRIGSGAPTPQCLGHPTAIPQSPMPPAGSPPGCGISLVGYRARPADSSTAARGRLPFSLTRRSSVSRRRPLAAENASIRPPCGDARE